jgi:hypothetical protein
MNPVPVGSLWDALTIRLRINTETEMQAMKDIVTMAYLELCAQHPWTLLRRMVTCVYAATDTSGGWFPADAVDIYGAVDSDGNEYFRTDKTNLQSDDQRYRWYIHEVCESPTLRTGFTLTPNSATVSGTTFSASDVGEYVTFGKYMGIYKIASTTTLSKAWRSALSEPATSVTARVRPEGTLRVAIVDYTGANITATVTFHYWAYPLPLVDEGDPILLPGAEALELKAAMRYLGDFKGDRISANIWRADFLRAVSAMKASDPIQMTGPVLPVGLDGNRLTLTRRR